MLHVNLLLRADRDEGVRQHTRLQFYCGHLSACIHNRRGDKVDTGHSTELSCPSIPLLNTYLMLNYEDPIKALDRFVRKLARAIAVATKNQRPHRLFPDAAPIGGGPLGRAGKRAKSSLRTALTFFVWWKQKVNKRGTDGRHGSQRLTVYGGYRAASILSTLTCPSIN